MPTLQISEFAGGGRDLNNNLIGVLGKAVAHQKVTIGGASAASAAVIGGLVRLATDTACCVAVGQVSGAAPTALPLSNANPHTYMPAGTVEVRQINVGDFVSVIAA